MRRATKGRAMSANSTTVAPSRSAAKRAATEAGRGRGAGYTVEDVATKLGYAQTRSLAQNVKEVLGTTPGELRVSLTPEEALARVRERYFMPASVQPLARVS